jgi:F0F1-type ATP synthase assembly protein I
MTGENGGKMDEDSHHESQPSATPALQFAGAGVQFAAILVASAFAGMWLDGKIGTSPWLLIVTVFFGAATGFYSLYRNLMKRTRLGDRRQHAERRDDAG